MKKTASLLAVFLMLGGTGFAQESAAPEKNLFHVTEENLQFFLDKSPFCVIYFYSSHHPESLKMKNLMNSLSVEKNPDIFLVNLDTNAGLRKTFQVTSLPSLVALKDRKLIYGLTGFVDDVKLLSEFISQGIKNASDE